MKPPPYGFYPAGRLCPSCRGWLVTATPVNRAFLKGPLQNFGVTCYCMACNTRYRATSWLRYGWVGWLGRLGRWTWWKTTSLEVTLRPEIPGSPVSPEESPRSP